MGNMILTSPDVFYDIITKSNAGLFFLKCKYTCNDVILSARSHLGATALHYAVFKDSPLHERRPRLATFLIAYGANFEACKNRHGQTLLTTELRRYAFQFASS